MVLRLFQTPAAGPPSSSCNFYDLLPQLLLHSVHLPLVAWPKGPLFLLKESLYVRINPGFAVWKTLYSDSKVLSTQRFVKLSMSSPWEMHSSSHTVESMQSLRASSDSSVHALTVRGSAGMHQVVVRSSHGRVGDKLYASLLLAGAPRRSR